MLEEARSTLLNGHNCFTSLLEDFIVMFDYRRVKKMKRFEEPSNTLRSTWQWNWWQIALGSLQLRSLFVLCRPFWFCCLATQTNPNPKYIDVLDHENPVPSPSMSLSLSPNHFFFLDHQISQKPLAKRSYSLAPKSIQTISDQVIFHSAVGWGSSTHPTEPIRSQSPRQADNQRQRTN